MTAFFPANVRERLFSLFFWLLKLPVSRPWELLHCPRLSSPSDSRSFFFLSVSCVDGNPVAGGFRSGGGAEHGLARVPPRGREPGSGAAQGRVSPWLHTGRYGLAELCSQLPVPLVLLVTPHHNLLHRVQIHYCRLLQTNSSPPKAHFSTHATRDTKP